MACPCRSASGCMRGSRGPRHRQRSPYGLHGGGPDDAPRRPHGADGHAGLDSADPGRAESGGRVRAGHAAGTHAGQGVAAPVDVFELVGASGIRRRLQATAARGLTRFVGRDTEFAALVQALERAGAGHGQVVAVVGEAGVGKSRLVYECVHSHHTQGWRVLESASVSYGKATPYFPVLDLLRRYAHVDEQRRPPHHPGQSDRAAPDPGRGPPGRHPAAAGAARRAPGRQSRS